MTAEITGTPITIAELAVRVASQIGANNVPLQAVDVVTDVVLNRTDHAGKMLKLNVQNIALTPGDWVNIGEGFNCVFVNLSGGNVILSGMVNRLGHTRVVPGGTGGIIAFSGPGGNEVRWWADATLP